MAGSIKDVDARTITGYSQWVRMPDENYDPTKCAFQRVPSTTNRPQCKRKPVITIAGYGYCKQHAQEIIDHVTQVESNQ